MFKKIIDKWFCLHVWETKAETTVSVINSGERYTRATYMCEKCGKFKQLRV